MIKKLRSIDAWVTVVWETNPLCRTTELARDVAHTSQYKSVFMFVFFSVFCFIYVSFKRQTPVQLRHLCPAPPHSVSSDVSVQCKAFGGWGAGHYRVHACERIFFQGTCTCWGRKDHYFVATACFFGLPENYLREIDPEGLLESILAIK